MSGDPRCGTTDRSIRNRLKRPCRTSFYTSKANLQASGAGENEMPKVIYRQYTGESAEVEVAADMNVMEGAVRNGVAGIDGDCGGACACATCHVYVAKEWLGNLQEQSDMERTMLEFALNVRSNSRLGCQIKLNSSLDGLTVDLPENQH